MLFCSEEGLAEAEPAGHCGKGHSHLGANASSSVIPNLLFQKMTAQPSGECEFNRVRFPQSLSVKGPGHRVDEVSQQQSIELMPSVERSDQIEIIAVNRVQKVLNPVWCDVCRFWRNDGAGFSAQQFCCRQNRSQGNFGCGVVSIDRADAVQGSQSIQVRRTLQVIDRGRGDDLTRAVLRSAIRVYDDHTLPGKILQEPGSNSLHCFSDRLGIIVRRHADKEVHLANADQFANKVIGKNACVVQTKPLSHLCWLSHPQLYPAQAEPVELVRAHSQQIRQVPDAWENIAAGHLHQNIALIAPQVEFHGLSGTGKIIDHEYRFILELPHIGEHAVVRGMQELYRTSTKDLRGLPGCYDAFHPREERMPRSLLRINVHRRITIYRIENQRRIKALGIG